MSATQIRNMIAKADEVELTQILQDLYGSPRHSTRSNRNL